MAVRPIIWRGLGLVAVWWILTGGDSTSWTIGGPVVALALFLTIMWPNDHPTAFSPCDRLLPPFFPAPLLARWSRRGLARLPARATDFTQAMIDYPLRLPPDDSSRIFFVNTLNLLPGTITVDMAENALRIHLLTQGVDVIARLIELESRVGRLFGHRLEERSAEARENEQGSRERDVVAGAFPGFCHFFGMASGWK
jgi:multicomponent Na+:H+ antiporter subunit E